MMPIVLRGHAVWFAMFLRAGAQRESEGSYISMKFCLCFSQRWKASALYPIVMAYTQGHRRKSFVLGAVRHYLRALLWGWRTYAKNAQSAIFLNIGSILFWRAADPDPCVDRLASLSQGGRFSRRRSAPAGSSFFSGLCPFTTSRSMKSGYLTEDDVAKDGAQSLPRLDQSLPVYLAPDRTFFAADN